MTKQQIDDWWRRQYHTAQLLRVKFVQASLRAESRNRISEASAMITEASRFSNLEARIWRWWTEER